VIRGERKERSERAAAARKNRRWAFTEDDVKASRENGAAVTDSRLVQVLTQDCQHLQLGLPMLADGSADSPATSAIEFPFKVVLVKDCQCRPKAFLRKS
jgi:hypothetical protein